MHRKITLSVCKNRDQRKQKTLCDIFLCKSKLSKTSVYAVTTKRWKYVPKTSKDNQNPFILNALICISSTHIHKVGQIFVYLCLNTQWLTFVALKPLFLWLLPYDRSSPKTLRAELIGSIWRANCRSMPFCRLILWFFFSR